ncbi:F-box/FBD/LRR-repeat protein [Cardamine amara subsp. amara]|uniref:F-box/FBD/LRR-repeat protein n=1 Tax=Cardamine amara subsp. amara TaxID=228776 RepID=A0ABD1BPW3_CARAN
MDRISQISDDLLIRILSHVPIKHVGATSCLSKRWQHLWSFVSNLEYDDSSHTDGDYTSFTQFVYRSLLSNKATVLESLYLTLGPKCQAVDIGIWIEKAVAHRVHSLTVNIYTFEIEPISLPSSLYRCGTLETLLLANGIHLDIPCSVCLPSLKILYLLNVVYADNGSLARLISACPKLEYLVVKQDKLHIVDDVLYDYHRIEYMPKLETACLDMTSHGVDYKFLGAFTCASRLYLSLPFSEVLYSSGMVFHRLVDLQVTTCAQGWWDLLTHMLQASPKLDILRLNDVHDPVLSSKETPDCWKRPSSVPECLLSSLEDFHKEEPKKEKICLLYW